jgi:hypothetical protein
MRQFLLFLTIVAVVGAPACAEDLPVPRKLKFPRRQPHLLVILIGGIDSDPTPGQIEGTAARQEGNSGLYQFAGDVEQELVMPEYFNWNGTRAGRIKDKNPPRAQGIANHIDLHLQEFPGDRIALVGNSWGGHTALEVLEDLVAREAPLAVHLVVFLDPSSTGRGPAKPKALPINVRRGVSYCTRNAFVWGNWDAGIRLENIDLGDPACGFIRNGQPPYNARFNTQAHITAEWDQRIHEDIRRRVIELLP